MAAQHEISNSPAAAREREIVITRILDAPRHLVYSVWTEAHHMKNWWGPRNFTNPVCEMDVRPGGIWRHVMRGPDGVDFECRSIYREVVPPERIVFEQSVELNGVRVLDGLTSVTLEEQGRKTKLTLRSKAVALVDAALVMLQGMEPGWTQSVDELEEWIAETGARTISTTRLFDAPRDLVFRVFTGREHVGHFWGPRGFSLTIHEMDVRPGGRWNFIMHGPDGRDYPNEMVYREISRPERLVLDHISPPKFQMTVTFAEASAQTRLTVEMLFDSAALRDFVVAEHGAVEGLDQMFDRLGERLAAAR